MAIASGDLSGWGAAGLSGVGHAPPGAVALEPVAAREVPARSVTEAGKEMQMASGFGGSSIRGGGMKAALDERRRSQTAGGGRLARVIGAQISPKPVHGPAGCGIDPRRPTYDHRRPGHALLGASGEGGRSPAAARMAADPEAADGHDAIHGARPRGSPAPDRAASRAGGSKPVHVSRREVRSAARVQVADQRRPGPKASGGRCRSGVGPRKDGPVAHRGRPGDVIRRISGVVGGQGTPHTGRQLRPSESSRRSV